MVGRLGTIAWLCLESPMNGTDFSESLRTTCMMLDFCQRLMMAKEGNKALGSKETVTG